MKKLNLSNQIGGDDELLVDLLRTSMIQDPQNDISNKTLEKLAVIQERHQRLSKPLKSPLLMMSLLCVFLALPLVLRSANWELLYGRLSDLEDFLVAMFKEINIWYLASTLLLFVALQLFLLLETRITNNRSILH